MRLKVRKCLKIFFLTFLSVLICLLTTFTAAAFKEDKQIKKLINDFKTSATFYKYSDYYDINFYKVENKNKDISPSFTIVDGYTFPGYNGDILTTLTNEMDIKILTNIFSFYFGGHAALVDNGNNIIETTGKSVDDENKVHLKSNNWFLDNTLRYSFIGLKVNTSQENKDKVVEYTKENLIGKKYNYSFIFNRKNSYYCTDLITRTYKDVANVSLNDDKLIASVQDIIVDNDTYIFMYKERNKVNLENRNENEKGNYNIYFLDDGNEYDFVN